MKPRPAYMENPDKYEIATEVLSSAIRVLQAAGFDEAEIPQLLAQAQGGVGGDANRLGGDALHPRARHAHRFGERAGREAERDEEFLAQDFAGVEWGEFLAHIWLS